MSNLQPNTSNVDQISFAQKLINSFKSAASENVDSDDEDGSSGFSIQAIENHINQFFKDESDKKKLISDSMPFGKYKFKLIKDIASFDKQYLRWLSRQDMLSNFELLSAEINKYV